MNRFPPRKILVPYDCSKTARLAWRHAEALARRFGCALEAVYVCPFYIGPEVVTMEPMGPAARLSLKNRIAEQLPRASGVRIAEGDVVIGILQAAKRCGADLILMATAGLTGLRRLRRASVTEDVVRYSPIPVMVARGEPRAPRSVLAPVTTADYSLPGLWLAAEVARAFGARLSALHAVAAPRDARALEELDARARSAGAGLALASGRPVPAILAEAPRHDLTVLVAHRKGLLRDAILGSTAEQVLRRARGSILTAPVVPAEPPERAGGVEERRARR